MNTNGCLPHPKNISQKHLIPRSKQFACFCHWAFPSDIFSHLLQNPMLKCLHCFPLPDYYLMISQSRYSWCAVSVFGIACAHGCPQGGQNGNLPLPANWCYEPNTSRKPEVSSLIDLILAMTVLFSNIILTLCKSRVHCCGVMQFWPCSSLISATLPAEAGCENWRSLCNSNIGSLQVAVVGV